MVLGDDALMFKIVLYYNIMAVWLELKVTRMLLHKKFRKVVTVVDGHYFPELLMLS